MSYERLVALCAAVALAYGCRLEVRRSIRAAENPVTVLGVFLAAWALALGLFAIPLVRYDHASFSTWVAIYGSILAFTLGSLIARRGFAGHGLHSHRQASSHEFDPRRLRLVWLGAAALGLVGLAGYLHAVSAVVGWHAMLHPRTVLSIQSKSPRFKSSYGSFTLLLYCNYVAVLLWTAGLRNGAFRGKWRHARGAGLLSVLALLIPVNRQLVFILVMWLTAFHILWRPPGNPRRLLWGLAAGVVVLLAFFVAVGSTTGSNLRSHPEIKRALTTQAADPLALPYVYLTADEPLLSKLGADPIRPHTYGQMTILPLVKLAHAAGVIAVPPEETAAFYPIPFDSYNSSTWLGPFLLDFGLLGCLILPLACGFAFTAMGIRAARERSLLWVWLASLALYIVAFTPLNNQLTIAAAWELALLGPVVAGLCTAGAGFRQRMRVAAARLRSAHAGVRAGLAVLGIALVLSVTLGRLGILRASAPALGEELASARQLVGRAQEDGGRLNSFVLASRLQAAQPAFTYVPLAQPGSSPAEPNVIGVYTGAGEVTLTGRTSNGALLSLHWPAPSARVELLRDGGFATPLPGSWASFRSPVATVTRRLAPGGYVLDVRGTGRSGTGSTVVVQSAGTLPDTHVGSVYELSLTARRIRLSRALAVELKATYVDGTYEFVDATIPRGDDRIMRGYLVNLTAKKPLFGLTVFAVDTGTRTFRGSLLLAALHLKPRP